jgi:hypothetical protein
VLVAAEVDAGIDGLQDDSQPGKTRGLTERDSKQTSRSFVDMDSFSYRETVLEGP